MTGSWERSKYSGKWGYTEEIAVMCIYLLEDYVKNFGTRRDRVGKAKLDEKYARSLGQFYFPGDKFPIQFDEAGVAGVFNFCSAKDVLS